MEISVRHNGTLHKAEAQVIRGTLWVHMNGRTFSMDAGAKKSRKKAGTAGSSDQVLAPMPGKITKLLVSEGQEIQAGQAVIVMEAMKMEYTLKSEIAGVVEKVGVALGDQVTLGKLLVKLKA